MDVVVYRHSELLLQGTYATTSVWWHICCRWLCA